MRFTIEYYDKDWTAFTADSGRPVYFCDGEGAKSVAKLVAITHNRYPTNFLDWRVVDSEGNITAIY